MRVVNFADGFTLEEPPMTSGAIQEEFSLLNNKSDWTVIEGYSFDKLKISSSDITVEVERRVDDTLLRQIIQMNLYHDGTEWKLEWGNFSGNDYVTNSELADEFSVALRINPVTGDFEYKSGYVVEGVHSGKFKFSTIRRKA